MVRQISYKTLAGALFDSMKKKYYSPVDNFSSQFAPSIENSFTFHAPVELCCLKCTIGLYFVGNLERFFLFKSFLPFKVEEGGTLMTLSWNITKDYFESPTFTFSENLIVNDMNYTLATNLVNQELTEIISFKKEIISPQQKEIKIIDPQQTNHLQLSVDLSN